MAYKIGLLQNESQAGIIMNTAGKGVGKMANEEKRRLKGISSDLKTAMW